MKALALLMLLPLAAQAAPHKIPAHGRFTLVVAGSVDQPMEGVHTAWMHRPGKEPEAYAEHDTAPTRIQPFTVPGFTSFQACVAAGLEMQARFRTDGYALDFVCPLIAQEGS